MANERASRDTNRVTSLLAITNDASDELRELLVDPSSGRLLVDSTGSSGGGTGSTNFATAQISVGTTATLIAASRAGRRAISVVNVGTTDTFIGEVGVTTSNGVLLLGVKGSAVTLEVIGAVYGIVGAGTVTVAYVEEY